MAIIRPKKKKKNSIPYRRLVSGYIFWNYIGSSKKLPSKLLCSCFVLLVL